MRKTILTFFLFAILISCSKKEKIDANSIPGDIPEWLQVKLTAIQKEQHSELYVVSEYRIDGVVFYNINKPVMSCMLCELYDVAGVRANISLDAQTEVKQVRVIWPVGR